MTNYQMTKKKKDKKSKTETDCINQMFSNLVTCGFNSIRDYF